MILIPLLPKIDPRMFGCGWNVYLLVQKYLGKTGICGYHWLPLGEYPRYQSDKCRSLTGTLASAHFGATV
jgi:hypothetical protein